MNITPLRQWKGAEFIDCSAPDSDRTIGFSIARHVTFCGTNLHYPNLLAQIGSSLISPYDERVMSLQRDSFYKDNLYQGSLTTPTIHEKTPVFFFALNVDNYFHFLYDSLPYLYYYKQICEKVPDCCLLVQTSHPSKANLPRFVFETFDLLGIKNIQFLKKDFLYEVVYFGLSLTHGGKSNAPPHPAAFSIWNALCEQANKQCSRVPIDKMYVSRRSWLSKDKTNIGTNYTTRRRCVNEDELVDYLVSKDYQEVFCEDLTMAEKIYLFSHAKEVTGVIGGGMCNVLFCPPSTKVYCLDTPDFSTINKRFLYSMQHTDLSLVSVCSLAPFQGNFSLYTRVKITGVPSYQEKVGEIVDYRNDFYTLQISNDGVAGFSQDFTYETLSLPEANLIPLDKGLNSPYVCNVESFKQLF